MMKIDRILWLKWSCVISASNFKANMTLMSNGNHLQCKALNLINVYDLMQKGRKISVSNISINEACKLRFIFFRGSVEKNRTVDQFFQGDAFC